ncbi:hypothetical protein MUN84_20580 [Hymenobacter sp. 5516J-16]|uniref:hypothetical protein n=1 Tax=Hymenobacter sp. 5516J-16 TaxID=2932253 RepID=UPI001FD0CB5D|nr:hypothetical protein [Hymenobacter sp. 5516J-16]UOQ76861.1 hypothetical protein MUN84_20580 [Hymenobacter sp. 5516J-16]
MTPPSPASSPVLPHPVKVIIWDLDDTFWKGTLSEGAVEALEENVQLVRDTAARGIVHTIVSKNDFAPAEAKLVELGIRELFVFPQISWQPKGPIIKQLLEQMQLRAPNALFLDDNSMNRAEAQYYNPELQVADPTDLPALSPSCGPLASPTPRFRVWSSTSCWSASNRPAPSTTTTWPSCTTHKCASSFARVRPYCPIWTG